MRYDIKRGNTVVANVRPEGKESVQMMGAEIVSMTFTLSQKINFEINDYCVVYGKTYYLSTEPSVDKKSTKEYLYNLQFVGIKYKLAEAQYFTYDSNNELTVPEFAPITDASTLVDLLISNANRIQSGWTKGVVDDTEHLQVDFNSENCLTAMNKIADAFDLEFWVDGNKSIHFTNRNEPSGYTFKYGKGNGLKGITRIPISENPIVTRLFAMGSDQNLPINYRNGQKKLRMPVGFLEKNVSVYGRKEHIETFDDIFPKRIGTVTAVDAENPLVFTDSTIDFDLNASDSEGNTTVLIRGTSAKVIFQDGQLAGYTFEVKEYGYNTATKTFTLLINQEEKTIELPSTAMRPQVGDKYILVDIQMPSNYVHDAEAELQEKAQEYLDKNCVQKLQYTVISDPIHFKNYNVDVTVGFTNRMIDAEFGLDDDLRVTATVKDLQNKYDVQFEMAESSSLSPIITTAIENQNQLSQIIKNIKFNTQLARLSYFFSREMFNKVFDGEGWFETGLIKPLSINTKAISLGTPMQAFALPNVSWYVENNLTSVSHTSGELVHFGLIENATRSWFLTESLISGISAKFNYIYIKAEKQGTIAIVVISEEQIMVESDPDFYYFEAGVLSSVNDGFRQIKMTHGFGMINPAEISIGRISSPFGGSHIEILQDKIKIHADVEFADDSIAFEQINGQIFIGGENLLQRSGELLEYYDFVENRDRYFNQELPFTYSVDALNTEATEATFAIIGKKASNNEYDVIASKEFQLNGKTERVHLSFKAFLNNYKRVFSALVKNSNSAEIPTIKPKLEIGNRPTDYNASQYDVDLKIAEIEKSNNWLSTNIYGNIIATGTVLLGNYDTGVNAGITGEGTVNDVFLWGGSTFSNRNTAPTRFYRNGDFYATNAHIEGYIKATNGDFTGNINATSGKFGIGDTGIEIFTQSSNFSGVRCKSGYFVFGNYENSGEINMLQLTSLDDNSNKITLVSEKPSSNSKNGMMISVKGSSARNTALHIANGDIAVNGSNGENRIGITTTAQIEEWNIEITKGIITRLTHTG